MVKRSLLQDPSPQKSAAQDLGRRLPRAKDRSRLLGASTCRFWLQLLNYNFSNSSSVPPASTSGCDKGAKEGAWVGSVRGLWVWL